MFTRQTLVFLSLLTSLSSAWVCYPPPQLLPVSSDCVALLEALTTLSHDPLENRVKRWSRHLASAALTEKLPKYFYLVDSQQPRSTTCAITVDAAGADFFAVGTFRLADVVEAGRAVYAECLARRGQLGLEFPSEEGHVYAKIVRVDGAMRGSGLLANFEDGDDEGIGWERWVVPGQMGVLYASRNDPGNGDNNQSAVRDQ